MGRKGRGGPRITRDARQTVAGRPAQPVPVAPHLAQPIMPARVREVRGEQLARAAESATGANTRPIGAYAVTGEAGPFFVPGDPLRPVPGLGDGAGGPRQYQYAVGTNITPMPRHDAPTSFADLRNLAALYDGVQLCQGVIFRVARRLTLSVVPRAEFLAPGEDASSDRWQGAGRAMEEWLEFPERPDASGRDLHAWLVAALRDNLELDAVAIFHRRTRGGQLHGLELVAGDTIAPLVDLGGRRPRFPQPAFAQVLYGVVASLWTESDLDYLVEHPRTDLPYGISPVERIIVRVNQALRKEHYDLTRFTDGAVPSGLLETVDPELRTLTMDQTSYIERVFNGMLAGNDAMRVRVRVVPPGWALRTLPENAIATEFDRWLLNITAAAHGLTMDELGFTETSNRSVGDAQERVLYRNAVQPRAEFFARYLTQIIRRYHGQVIAPRAPSLSGPGQPTRGPYRWDGRYVAQFTGVAEPTDFLAQAQAASTLVASGILDRDEARRWLKLPSAVLGHGRAR